MSRSTKVGALPDVERIGGDTTPLVLELVDNDGRPIPYSTMEDAECTLTVAPTSTSGGTAFDVDGEVSESTGGGTKVTFEFAESDTKQLVGTYVYQVDVVVGDSVRIRQGKFIIHGNLLRT